MQVTCERSAVGRLGCRWCLPRSANSVPRRQLLAKAGIAASRLAA